MRRCDLPPSSIIQVIELYRAARVSCATIVLRSACAKSLTAATISYSAAARANESAALDRISINFVSCHPGSRLQQCSVFFVTCTSAMHGPEGAFKQIESRQSHSILHARCIIVYIICAGPPPGPARPGPAGLSPSLLCLLGHLNVRWNAHAQAAAPVPRR